MSITPYRHVLALPGVRALMVVAMLARIPVTAFGITLTLHVVLTMHRGYAAAGLVGGAFTVGAALGSPLLGRLVDRRGLRPMLVLTSACAAVFWAVVPLLPYPALPFVALLGGLVAIPVFTIIRQSLAALVPEEQRKPAYSMDSMSVELSFMAGPPLAVLAVTRLSTGTAVWLVGAAMVLAGIGLWLMNPPIRAAHEAPIGAPVRRRSWLRPRLVAVLLAAATATMILGATDVSVVGFLQHAGDVQWTGLVLGLWGLYSMVGGFVYGGMRRSPHPLVLTTVLGLATVPVGLAAGVGWLAFTLIPAGLLCAPVLAATADAVSRLVPAGARGEAMGLYGSALTTGLAIGAPFAGAIIDSAGPSWAFAVVGAVGAGAALLAFVVSGVGRAAAPTPVRRQPAEAVLVLAGRPDTRPVDRRCEPVTC